MRFWLILIWEQMKITKYRGHNISFTFSLITAIKKKHGYAIQYITNNPSHQVQNLAAI
jgi:hypothetical protein